MENSIITENEFSRPENIFNENKHFLKYCLISNTVFGITMGILLVSYVWMNRMEGLNPDNFFNSPEFLFAIPFIVYGYFLLLMYFKFKRNSFKIILYRRWVWFSSFLYNIGFVLSSMAGFLFVLYELWFKGSPPTLLFLAIFIVGICSFHSCIMVIGSYKIFAKYRNLVKKSKSMIQI